MVYIPTRTSQSTRNSDDHGLYEMLTGATLQFVAPSHSGCNKNRSKTTRESTNEGI